MNLIAQTINRALRLQPMRSACVDQRVWAVDCGFTNFFVCRRDGAMIVIDTGFSVPAATRGMTSLGLNPAEVSHVFLTHSDFDHAGGYGAFPNARVYLSEDEERLIAGHRATRLYGIGRNPRLKCDYTLLGDNQTIDIGSLSVRAIKTPGHTVGSMSYVVDGTLLFSGDTLSLCAGKAVPNRYFRTDEAELRRSFQKLSRLNGVERLYTAHRGSASFQEAMNR